MPEEDFLDGDPYSRSAATGASPPLINHGSPNQVQQIRCNYSPTKVLVHWRCVHGLRTKLRYVSAAATEYSCPGISDRKLISVRRVEIPALSQRRGAETPGNLPKYWQAIPPAKDSLPSVSITCVGVDCGLLTASRMLKNDSQSTG